MKSNFAFLESYWTALAQIGAAAENYVYTDPNACLYKLGMFAERMVSEIFAFEGLPEDGTHADRIRILKREGIITREIDDMLYALRIKRNDAVHAGADSPEDAQTLLKMTYRLACWFMEVYGDWNYRPEPFVMPEKIALRDYEALEATIVELTQKLKQAETAVSEKNLQERAEKSKEAAQKMELSEKETRYLIDEQLRKFSWEANSQRLRYSKGIRPQKGRNLAIAEFPTDSAVSQRGFADYALFIGLQLVGIIEAKKEMTDIPSVIDYQCKDYAKHIKPEHEEYIISRWGEYAVPFVFATNGRKYLKQLETKSGIWFQDLRDSKNIPKALQGWMSPQGITELLAQNLSQANQKLQEMPLDLLRDPDGLNLRKYQIKGIQAAENAVLHGKKKILLSMATGTGKTRTILGMIYRFIKSGRFKRVLFLVDRTALGEQASDVFKEVKIEELMTLDEIYNIKGLDDQQIEKETRIHIATVQSLVKRILYQETDSMLSVTDYDLIVVDEAHRGYTLDHEMSDAELLYRNQEDYVSKYRTVIDYFDAVKIGLTATPALHTSEIFGLPVFTYSYREAVIDGYLVDHDAPHHIRTKLNTEGIQYKKGEHLAELNPITGEVTNSAALEDDMKFEVNAFNKQIIVPEFNKTVLEEIAPRLNPNGKGKTLIYAVDDDHADVIVDILRKIYEKEGIPSDAVLKITGSVAGGNKKKILEAIKRFKNEQYPKIVVTVDLLTTGIDVPEITNLVFMRRIKSRILFEQMLGRATRLCPEIGKTHFEIYDPVGVYETLQDVSNMKPVSPNPTARFSDLLHGLEVITNPEQTAYQIDLILAKLQRKKQRLTESAKEQFQYLTGCTPDAYIRKIQDSKISDAKESILNHREAFELLDDDKPAPRPKILDLREDEFLKDVRGYGEAQKPEDYLEAFGEFVRSHRNQIDALNILCTRPSELTRESLKSLLMELDRKQFTEQQLNTAYRQMTNSEIVANMIAFIRQQAIGSALISHETRVRNAFAKLKLQHDFTDAQLNWLSRIESTMLKESILDESLFEMGAFRTVGGFQRINKNFDGKLHEIIIELNEYLYDDGGKAA